MKINAKWDLTQDSTRCRITVPLPLEMHEIIKIFLEYQIFETSEALFDTVIHAQLEREKKVQPELKNPDQIAEIFARIAEEGL